MCSIVPLIYTSKYWNSFIHSSNNAPLIYTKKTLGLFFYQCHIWTWIDLLNERLILSHALQHNTGLHTEKCTHDVRRLIVSLLNKFFFSRRWEKNQVYIQLVVIIRHVTVARDTWLWINKTNIGAHISKHHLSAKLSNCYKPPILNSCSSI